MSKTYKGSFTLEFYNKQNAVLFKQQSDLQFSSDIPAPKVNWVNKDEVLFYEINNQEGKGVEPFWVDRQDIRIKEIRPLILQKSFYAITEDAPGTLPGTAKVWKISESSKDDPTTENILIKGDNLLALNSLKKMFSNKPDEEKVKCIYIDPPYNTGQAFELYDDNLTHSEWLTLMRDRLIILFDLLRSDGVLFIQLDDAEVHYAKILLDEIFGRANFVNMICYERSGSAGIGQGGFFVDTAEYILIYAKNKDNTEFNDVLESSPLDYETMKRYKKVLQDLGNKQLVKEFISKSNGLPIKIYKHKDYVIDTISLRDFENRESNIRKEYCENFRNIFRTTNPQAENSFQNELISFMEEGLYTVEYTPSRGKYKDQLINTFYINNEIFAWLKDTALLENNEIVKQNKLSTVWLHGDIPKADLANEGGVELKRSKKPEQLIKKILDLSTLPGDLVLDCFGGSGTTCCVAHKMDRKWIGVEIGKPADLLFLPRLKNVISGVDQSGISKSVNWLGGGSFKYYHLGPSIIKLSADGSNDFNWSLGKKYIEESLLASYDYHLINEIELLLGRLFDEPDLVPSVGIQKIGSKSRIAIITLNPPKGIYQMLSFDEVITIYTKIKKKYSPEYINVFTNRGVEIAFDSKPDDLEIIKIPHAIFSELEK